MVILKAETVYENFHFLRENFYILLRVMPNEVVSQGGFAKAVKVLLGVLIHGISNLSQDNQKELISKYLKIGYYWGVTYPLVDDILDAKIVFSPIEATHFNSLLFKIFNGEDIANEILNYPFVQELFRCLSELQKILPVSGNRATYQIISMAHSAQLTDNEKMLHKKYEEDEIYTGIILKAALVRIATASLCGIQITEKFVKSSILMSVHNQQEDDCQDFFGDLNASRVTPFTLFYNGNLSENPFKTFLTYNQFIVEKLNSNRDVRRILLRQLLEIVKMLVLKNGLSNFYEFLEIFLEDGELLKIEMKKLSNYVEGIELMQQEIVLLRYLDQSVATIMSKVN